ncbi:MAG: hypothetical protein ACI4WU_04905 [Bacilli bacterium]
MNRASRRKKQRTFNKKLTPEQFQQLTSEVNMTYVERAVQDRMKCYELLFKESLIEAFKRQNYPTTKAKALLEDVALIMKRKVEGKKDEMSKERLSN